MVYKQRKYVIKLARANLIILIKCNKKSMIFYSTKIQQNIL